MSKIIEILRSLDRKERFAVLRETLGFDRIAPELRQRFPQEAERLHRRTGAKEHAFVAMDYHLDWIQIALHLAANPGIDLEKPFESPDVDNINKDQEDIDLLVTFETGDENSPATHLVLIEAKAYLPWTNEQLKSKTGRLREIFGENRTQAGVVFPHFVLMTGRRSDNIQTREWPGWTKDAQGNPFWLEYDLPGRRKVTRCTEGGKPDKCGGHLRLDCVPLSSG